MNPFLYGESPMTITSLFQIAQGELAAIISPTAQEKIQKSSQIVDKIAHSDKTVYGINTGFGILKNKRISAQDGKLLQHKILQSHSSGIGKPIPTPIAKLMLITKVHALAQGFSGCQLSTLERLIWFIDNDVIPVVPEQGSVGASGDLAPLSHLCLPLIGCGEVMVKGECITAEEMMKRFQLQAIELTYKEGLALINGTQFMLAHAAMAVKRLQNILDTADVVGAMSLEAMQGSTSPFQDHFHRIRPYKGNILVAQRMRALLQDSQILTSHQDCDQVQDPYSLRCIPQVHGAARNAWLHLKETTEIELNAVTDNPIIFSEEDTISGGHFHGQPIALPMDYMCFAAAELGNISDRRTYLLLEGQRNLPTLLMENTGLNSGFMIPQYTTAALVTENKTHCFPASADSIPTSLGQEDHVSMGSISGRKLHTVLDNVERILGIELLCSAQALDFRKPLQTSPVLKSVHTLVRQEVQFASEDRIFSTDMELTTQMVSSGKVSQCSEQEAQKQGLELFVNYPEFNIN